MRSAWRALTVASLSTAALFAGSASAAAEATGAVHPESWPALAAPVTDPAIEQRIDTLIAAMSIEQKVGQIIQGDIGSTTPEDVATYHLGSILNGGSSSPGGDEFGPASAWVAAADAYYDASMRPNGNLPRIPVMWGSDAVHGHNNIVGATLFPHNIGLGAARNPALMEKIGQATAIEMRVTGLDWTFAPTIAVARDDRWGRTYESFGEDPAIAESYAAALVHGIQGRRGDPDWLRGPHIIATAKHFLADGGTADGRDRGDARIDEAELIRLHAPAYVAALKADVQSVMASFSGWNGVKMHGNVSLLTGVLKQRWGFDGLVVGDWDGHAKVPGCTPTDCPASIAAGLDIYMGPASWKGLYASTLAAARSGALPMGRLEDAVRRILRVKLRAGLFGAGRPSSRPYAARYDLLGAPEHRAIARQAVRESLVLLKSNGILPLKADARILVVGDGADDVARQSGGWTLTWQGTGTRPEHFPGATSIFAGVRDVAQAGGGSAELVVDGRYSAKPDAAIIVFGEDPYAEFQGDRADLYFDDTRGNLDIMNRLKAAGIPVVAVFLSGRPLWVNRHINAADAFVAAWLPGSEGGGVADILFGKADFKGKLPFSWPADARGAPLNVGDAGYKPLYPFGFGLTLTDRKRARALSEDPGIIVEQPLTGPIFARGRPIGTRQLQIDGANDSPQAISGAADNGAIAVRPIDRDAQEDAREIIWAGKSRGTLIVANPRAANLSGAGSLALTVDLKIDQAPTAPATLELRCGPGCTARLDIGPRLAAIASKGWQSLSIPLSCLPDVRLDNVTAPFALSSNAPLRLTLSSIALTPIKETPCR
ncbi:exo-1,4-beta-glucosidase [Sphingopyxis sp. YR583]|uniref:glycoside hydrolase family 3 protein n=1 Tax=Sphingopyxis sp. YR583 TaxID=1881047 RepID=UPI0008A80115|nr:exo 1,3/1,4-beta-D-glucan glucohydrolase [Sphingopyxis sp. YR583]SEH16251.1 exo-1,4-beta-glucosidase [Sphingopyxis sp. YR583]